MINIPLATRLRVHVPRKEAVFFFFDVAFIKMPIYSRHFEMYPILTPRLCIYVGFISRLSLESVETVSKTFDSWPPWLDSLTAWLQVDV